MASLALLIFSLLGFSLAARGLGETLLSRRHLLPYQTGYSYAALKLERTYKVFAYLVLAIVLFAGLVTSFIEVLGGLPF